MNITQEDINKYVENGGDLRVLTDEQIVNIPQEFINKRAENGATYGLFQPSKKPRFLKNLSINILKMGATEEN